MGLLERGSCKQSHSGGPPLSKIKISGLDVENCQVERGLSGSVWDDAPTSVASFSDGTGSTVLMAEWVRSHKPVTKGDTLSTVLKVAPNLYSASTFDVFLSACVSASTDLATSSRKGGPWASGGFSETLHNHNLNINENTCISSGMVPEGAWTAGSRHAAGVNCLFADSHVTSLKPSISLYVWRAIGTRSNGEIVSSDAF
ncbi:DUF1559 family PulG-like putative transporter [Singulisphaera rosea]